MRERCSFLWQVTLELETELGSKSTIIQSIVLRLLLLLLIGDVQAHLIGQKKYVRSVLNFTKQSKFIFYNLPPQHRGPQGNKKQARHINVKEKYILNTDRQTRCVAVAVAHAQSGAGAVKKSESSLLQISGNVYKNGKYFGLFLKLDMRLTVYVAYRSIHDRK